MITLVAAHGLNRAIGKDNRLLWDLPLDMARFVELTAGKTVVMGSATYRSIGKALPRRRNIVMSRDENFHAPKCMVVGHVNGAIAAAEGRDVMVIGGEEIYRLFLPLADCMELTVVDDAPLADRFFPEYDAGQWRTVESSFHGADSRHSHSMQFLKMMRMKDAENYSGASFVGSTGSRQLWREI